MIEPDAAEMEAQGLRSAGVDHAHATELMAEAGVTLPRRRDGSGGLDPLSRRSNPPKPRPPMPPRRRSDRSNLPDPLPPPSRRPAEPAEPILIEVWRLHRHHREAGPRHARGRPDQRRGGAPRCRRRQRSSPGPTAAPGAPGGRDAAVGSAPRSWPGQIRRAAGRAARRPGTGAPREQRQGAASGASPMTAARIAARSGAKRRRIRTPPSPSSSP